MGSGKESSCPSTWLVQPLVWLLNTLGSNFKTTLNSFCNETGISYVRVDKCPFKDVKCYEESAHDGYPPPISVTMWSSSPSVTVFSSSSG